MNPDKPLNLYELPVHEVEFVAFCGGNLGGEHETCLAVAEIPGAANGYVLRDTKPEGARHEVRATVHELDAFALGWARRRGLTP
ncbi:DUF397 domain-containing protein [Streptomyces millisiae]|uniref:DUF397 domain-containing protein n=1 Tax=Streptomyces millisiae TaxID=3075542 RepID=A0ABU2LPL7_9ACTN|nr:DUF397 domain-containing protein [Streptomyces sp. DSM 44918]MDT0319531.1 DUF397 domain-containing protein [Streptomyces sp. DSM 44918]